MQQECCVGLYFKGIYSFFSTGPILPNPPLLGEVTTFPERAVIWFTISSFAYNAENYTVMLARDVNNLTAVNGILSGADPTDLTFLTATNINYTIEVDGLVIFQRYYYVIVATNSAGSTNSTLGNFTTSEAREQHFPAVLMYNSDGNFWRDLKEATLALDPVGH